MDSKEDLIWIFRQLSSSLSLSVKSVERDSPGNLACKGTRKHLTMKRRRGSIVLCVGKLLAENSPSIGTLRFARKSLKLSLSF